MIGADVLLTGTGGVGRDVLVALLQRTPARVALLMRDATLNLDTHDRARVDVLGGDISAPNLALHADVRGRLTETLETIVHPSGATADVLMLAERCFMAGRLQRFIHVNRAAEDRMVRAAMNAGANPPAGRVGLRSEPAPPPCHSRRTSFRSSSPPLRGIRTR